MRGHVRFAAVVTVVGFAVMAGGSGSAGSVLQRWVITDLEAGRNASHLWATGAVAINAGGQVIGEGADASGGYGRAFVWQNGTMTDLGSLGGNSSTAEAINDRAQIVGSSDTKTGVQHAFLWQRGRMRDLGTLPGKKWSAAVAISQRGQVIGYGYTVIESKQTPPRTERRGSLAAPRETAQYKTAPRAFVWQNGRMTDLGTLGGRSSAPTAINDRGQVVGWSTTKSGVRHAFLWQQGQMRDLGTLSGKRASKAVAINARGQIVGDSYAKLDRDGHEAAPSAFLWQNGKMRELGTLSASSSAATAINARGQVIGITLADNSRGRTLPKAFLWQSGKMSYLSVRGSESIASAINDRGQIVGSAGGASTMEPVLWENGKMTILGVLDVGGREPWADPASINERGQIAGTSHAMMASQHATLWTRH